ncbi:MAG: mannosyltransferase, partial [Solirubrobacteraceae bacterium]|nr:mannosyltransferase [Solirubrobacteraceae bacterium]
MATSAPSSIRLPRVRALARVPPRVMTTAGLAVITLLSVLIRTQKLGSGLWVDEGLSFGIADRPLTDIPGVMRKDGSPPLYYMIVHVWTRTLGVRSEQWLHALSLIFAVLAIFAAFALARALFGVRAGWLAALLIAFNPYLNQYAQEARMYSLVVLLSITTVGAFVGAFALERGRRWVVGYAVSQVVLLYTHNWGLFLGAGLTAAWIAMTLIAEGEARRALIRAGLTAAGIILVLYAPWLPTLAYQAAHTGAPWANSPSSTDLISVPRHLLGYTAQWLLVIGGGAAILALVRGPARRWPAEGRAVLVLILALVVAMGVPWLLSQSNPAWALRYEAVGVAPLILLAARGAARAGMTGL